MCFVIRCKYLICHHLIDVHLYKFFTCLDINKTCLNQLRSKCSITQNYSISKSAIQNMRYCRNFAKAGLKLSQYMVATQESINSRCCSVVEIKPSFFLKGGHLRGQALILWTIYHHDINNSSTLYRSSQISTNTVCQMIRYQLISDASCPTSSYCLNGLKVNQYHKQQ